MDSNSKARRSVQINHPCGKLLGLAILAVRTAEKSLEAAQFAEHAATHDAEQARAAWARYRADISGKAVLGTR